MQKVKAFFINNWHILAAVVLLVIVIYLIYRAGKKAGAGPTVISDTGAITQADRDKANSLAVRLKDDLGGLNVGHDDAIYLELAQTSNTVFSLTFGAYRTLSGNSLTADINSDYWYGWDVIDVIINRATDLNLS